MLARGAVPVAGAGTETHISMTYGLFVLFRLVSVYVLSFNAKTCVAVFHVFLLCLTILQKSGVSVV